MINTPSPVKLVKFYKDRSTSVWINPSHVVSVERNESDTATEICAVKWIFYVKESVDEVINKLEHKQN